MMAKVIILFVAICLSYIGTDATECENGWTLYKDENCIKVFSDFLTYDEAKYFCESQGNSVSAATLVTVKDSDIQDFLVNHTSNIYDYIWLGARYDNATAQFKWEDGDSLTYTNWADGYPRNISNSDLCIQLKPKNAKQKVSIDGKWEDAVCQRRNLAVCQRTAPWSLEDAIREIQNLRKELLSTKQELRSTTQRLEGNLESTKQELGIVNSRVVPVGSIYIEYHNQPSPTELWPALGWEDITSSYAGNFFRALGGNSETWGVVQNECAPRLAQVRFSEDREAYGSSLLTLPDSDWSDVFHVGSWYPGGDGYHEHLRFNVEKCEVRPRNEAIRIWKRSA